jgi:hypothetical protein
MIDVVYLLGKGSKWSDHEIRYSLRSLEKHGHDFRKVFVIGHKPDFLNEKIIHVPYQDVYSNRSRNIMAKIHWMAGDPRMTQEFMVLNDDYFFLQDFSCINYPYYYKCDLKQSVAIQQNEYTKYCLATLKVLTEAGLNTKNFDTHLPITYNKLKFRNMCAKYNWHIPHGYIVRSMYCNHYGIEGVLREDVKISHPYNLKQLEAMNEHRPMFSTGDNAMNNAMKTFIYHKYPKKSMYEY